MAKHENIDLVVITPEQQVLKAAVDAVVIPAHDGELGVLPDRAPLMCELGIGQLRYASGGQTRRLFIDGGFAQVHENHVSVLTNRAVPAEEISPELLAKAEAAAAERVSVEPEAQAARRDIQERARVLKRIALR